MSARVDSNYITTPGFAPDRIVTTTVLNTESVLAFAPEVDTAYQLNGAGEFMTLRAGHIRAVAMGVNTVTFNVATKLEVSDI